MKYHFRFYPPKPRDHDRGDFGYVHCVELFGCSASLPSASLCGADDSTIDHQQLARSAARRALAKYLEVLPIDNLTPLPTTVPLSELNKDFLFGAHEIFEAPAPPAAVLAIKLRRLRAQRLLMQSDAAARLGWPHLYSYQRLEDPRKCNPTLSTLNQLKQVFPDLDIADLFEP